MKNDEIENISKSCMMIEDLLSKLNSYYIIVDQKGKLISQNDENSNDTKLMIKNIYNDMKEKVGMLKTKILYSNADNIKINSELLKSQVSKFKEQIEKADQEDKKKQAILGRLTELSASINNYADDALKEEQVLKKD
jgi:hypothetical protein